MKALYRKYRPVRLSEVIGQEQATTPLENAIKTGKVSHAYLFVGPRGCGKTSVARILAHQVNNFKYEIEDDYVDIIEIDGASNRGIDNIRELREKVAIAPTVGKYKVYIIDEVHMLTKEAFNALLKTLEEPPEHVIFIMATTDAYKVPVTITSRAQCYTFKLATTESMTDYLKQICNKEKIQISDEALDVISRRGGGSFRDTLSLLDQISTLSSDMITKDLVVSALGLPQDEVISELLRSYLAGDADKITRLLRELLASGIKAETLVDEMIGKIVAEPDAQLLALLAKLPEVKAPYAEAKLLVALYPENAGSRSSFSSQPPSGVQLATDFSWAEFLEKVRSKDSALSTQLMNCKHELKNNELDIFPDKSFIGKTLMRDKNKAILVECANGIKVNVKSYEEYQNLNKDALISKMSDIMGGEVQNDGGDSPF